LRKPRQKPGFTPCYLTRLEAINQLGRTQSQEIIMTFSRGYRLRQRPSRKTSWLDPLSKF
jgi:hypothetical protein